MAMVNMQEEEDKSKKVMLGYEDDSEEDKGPSYPYGLRIRLCSDELDKLRLTNLPNVGTKILLSAKTVVTRTQISEEAQSGEGVERCLELQITDMEFSPPENQQRTAASVLYGESE